MADARYGPPEWPPPRTQSPPRMPPQPGTQSRPYGQTPHVARPAHVGGGYPAAEPRSSAPRHGTTDRRRPTAPAPRKSRRLDANRWHWLLLVPIVVPLLPGIYNRMEPTLFGLPFFYWGQLGFAFLSSAVIAFVHFKVR
jgi:hypothetical protein